MYLRAFFNRVNINIMNRRYVVDCKFSLEYVVCIELIEKSVTHTLAPFSLAQMKGYMKMVVGIDAHNPHFTRIIIHT